MTLIFATPASAPGIPIPELIALELMVSSTEARKSNPRQHIPTISKEKYLKLKQCDKLLKPFSFQINPCLFIHPIFKTYTHIHTQ